MFFLLGSWSAWLLGVQYVNASKTKTYIPPSSRTFFSQLIPKAFIWIKIFFSIKYFWRMIKDHVPNRTLLKYEWLQMLLAALYDLVAKRRLIIFFFNCGSGTIDYLTKLANDDDNRRWCWPRDIWNTWFMWPSVFNFERVWYSY